jgi:hypothetical protein
MIHAVYCRDFSVVVSCNSNWKLTAVSHNLKVTKDRKVYSPLDAPIHHLSSDLTMKNGTAICIAKNGARYVHVGPLIYNKGKEYINCMCAKRGSDQWERRGGGGDTYLRDQC